jgi:hypothetical protein
VDIAGDCPPFPFFRQRRLDCQFAQLAGFARWNSVHTGSQPTSVNTRSSLPISTYSAA